ncbi:uncharacterized protein I206_106797 [Kwoniella pini CBS 10737]|uniref:Uncharacterized protein n=1 Tax=Kwoniella pini CBS 10737 TaxID=1296096 RepID=A0A1B9I035_9TREE|nr:uncharacterized protein I206_05655 [Kwoniella pini CBS 10737]OCF48874.1 hypothetical protein I206_05655 [Kwoniella pini CBS 10737]
MPASQTAFFPRPTQINPLLTTQHIADVNTISSFLSSPSQLFDFEDPANTVYVLVGSAILPTLKATFDHITQCQHPVTLVLSGGIGHSTSLLHDAVSRHKTYSSISADIQGLPEAQVFKLLLIEFWPSLRGSLDDGSVKLLIDDRSTNCGANAIETKRELDIHKIRPKRLFIVQDPTMHRRTLATFEKVFQDAIRTDGLELVPWSFHPKLKLSNAGLLSWDIQCPSIDKAEDFELWDSGRFIGLVLGEIPRLRDDENGYGPKGAGYIAHVDIPKEVEEAWSRLTLELKSQR